MSQDVECFASPSASQFEFDSEDPREEEPLQEEEEQKEEEEEEDDFSDDVGDTEEEEEEEAYNVPEATINTVLCGRLFDKGGKLQLFNDCYDQKDEFIPLISRGNNDRKQQLDLLFSYRLANKSKASLIAQKLTLLLHYVLEAGKLIQ